MKRLLNYIVRYRARYALGLVCLLATASLAMAIPYLLKRAVDAYASGEGGELVAGYALAMAVIAGVQAVVRTFSRFLIFNVGRDVEYDLRNDLFAKLETLPPRFYQGRQTGDLMSRLVNDITAVRLLLGLGVLILVNTTIYYAYGLALMCTFDVSLTFLALLPYPLALIVVKRASRHVLERSLRLQEGLGELGARVQENVGGMHVIQAHTREAHEAELFARVNERFAAQNMALARVRGALLPVMKLVASIGTVVVLWVGGRRVMAGRLSIGDLFAFIGYLHILAWPSMAFGWMLTLVQRGRAAMQRLDEILAEGSGLEHSAALVPPPAIRGEIELRDVEFGYGAAGDGRAVLKGINLHIPAGKTTAIVGRTGSGKSTLVQLLPRLFEPTAGTIRIDGHDLRTLPLSWLRPQIGVVLQDPFLFSASVRDNIAFGSRLSVEAGVSLDEKVGSAARIAALDRDLASLPRGLDTMVGERGVTLSGGQKQRVTLARALLAEPRVLILDDALSSVDAETERKVLERLATIMQGRTCVVITHRISTVKQADLIVVLDEGSIVEAGDHDTLMAGDGIYADLFRRRILEEELDAI